VCAAARRVFASMLARAHVCACCTLTCVRMCFVVFVGVFSRVFVVVVVRKFVCTSIFLVCCCERVVSLVCTVALRMKCALVVAECGREIPQQRQNGFMQRARGLPPAS
jgi:hypothetical protein